MKKELENEKKECRDNPPSIRNEPCVHVEARCPGSKIEALNYMYRDPRDIIGIGGCSRVLGCNEVGSCKMSLHIPGRLGTGYIIAAVGSGFPFQYIALCWTHLPDSRGR